jgi:hypothetical protein
MCDHAHIFHLWVKCQLAWIVQITRICDIHLCITIQSNSQNIKHCSISNSLWYEEGNLCLIFLANGNENTWPLIEFILPQYISTHVILQTNMAGRIPCWVKSQYSDKQNPNILQLPLLPDTDCLPHAEHCVRGYTWQLEKAKAVNMFNQLQLERSGDSLKCIY